MRIENWVVQTTATDSVAGTARTLLVIDVAGSPLL